MFSTQMERRLTRCMYACPSRSRLGRVGRLALLVLSLCLSPPGRISFPRPPVPLYSPTVHNSLHAAPNRLGVDDDPSFILHSSVSGPLLLVSFVFTVVVHSCVCLSYVRQSPSRVVVPDSHYEIGLDFCRDRRRRHTPAETLVRRSDGGRSHEAGRSDVVMLTDDVRRLPAEQ